MTQVAHGFSHEMTITDAEGVINWIERCGFGVIAESCPFGLHIRAVLPNRGLGYSRVLTPSDSDLAKFALEYTSEAGRMDTDDDYFYAEVIRSFEADVLIYPSDAAH